MLQELIRTAQDHIRDSKTLGESFKETLAVDLEALGMAAKREPQQLDSNLQCTIVDLSGMHIQCVKNHLEVMINIPHVITQDASKDRVGEEIYVRYLIGKLGKACLEDDDAKQRLILDAVLEATVRYPHEAYYSILPKVAPNAR